jgi:hypothetical protein
MHQPAFRNTEAPAGANAHLVSRFLSAGDRSMATVPKLLATEQIAPIPDSDSIKASDVGQEPRELNGK